MHLETIHFDNASEARELEKVLIPLLKKMEEDFSLQIIMRDLSLKISGEKDSVLQSKAFIEDLRQVRDYTTLDPQVASYAYNAFRRGEKSIFSRLASIRIDVSTRKPAIFPKTLGQRIYLDAMQNHAITFGIGPAGTGKTYLAMAMAVSTLMKEEVSRIILTRPAIEAGENLGYLPGDLHQKISPYLRPLYDALHDMMPPEQIESHIERGTIEVAPLAYMRGRTLNNAFIILDEAQNTTPQQMLMFLTRLGFDSRCTITGDPTQIDLPNRHSSGLLEARLILGHIAELKFVELSENDVVRHPLIQKVIEAYREKESILSV